MMALSNLNKAWRRLIKCVPAIHISAKIYVWAYFYNVCLHYILMLL